MSQPSASALYQCAAWLCEINRRRAELETTRRLLRTVRLHTAAAAQQASPRLLVAKDPILVGLTLLRRLVPSGRGLCPRFEHYLTERLRPTGCDPTDPEGYVAIARGLLGCLLRLECVFRALEAVRPGSPIADLFAPRTRWLRTLFQLADDN